MGGYGSDVEPRQTPRSGSLYAVATMGRPSPRLCRPRGPLQLDISGTLYAHVAVHTGHDGRSSCLPKLASAAAAAPLPETDPNTFENAARENQRVCWLDNESRVRPQAAYDRFPIAILDGPRFAARSSSQARRHLSRKSMQHSFQVTGRNKGGGSLVRLSVCLSSCWINPINGSGVFMSK